MESTFERCLQDFRSDDAGVRAQALERLLALDDPRVPKCLEALVGDPSEDIANRAREELAMRTGEAIGQKWVAPDLGHMGVADCLVAAARLLGRHPGALLGTALLALMILPIVALVAFSALSFTVGVLWIPVGMFPNSPAVALLATLGSGGAFFLMIALLAIVVSQSPYIISGLLAWVVGRIYLGTPVTLGAAVAFCFSRIGPLIRTSIARTLLVMKPMMLGLILGLAVLIAGGGDSVFGALSAIPVFAGGLLALVAYLSYAFSDVACVTEGIGGRAACERSRRLWETERWTIVRFLATMWALSMIFHFLLGAVIGNQLVLMAAGLVLGVWYGLAQVVMYYNLTVRSQLRDQS